MALVFTDEMPSSVCELFEGQNHKSSKAKRQLVTAEAFCNIYEASRIRFGPPPSVHSITTSGHERSRVAFDVCKLFQSSSPVKVIAPMVKYSRAEFRALCRAYGCQVGYTPMVIAEDMIKSGNWTRSDLFAVAGEQALVAQFAANDASEIVQCSQSVYWGCDGVDINLGCPQKFALRRRFGAALLDDFELVADMIRSLRHANPTSEEKPFSISVKIRIMPNLRKTVDLCQKAEHAGVSYITVHGRYPHQKDHGVYPADWKAIRTVKDAVALPVVANGDVHTVEDYGRVSNVTDCDGVMIASGLLANPALFECDETPMECMLRWFSLFEPPPQWFTAAFGGVDDCRTSLPVEECALAHAAQPSAEAFATYRPIVDNVDFNFVTFHNHLIHMVNFADKREKSIFASLSSRYEIAHFLLNEWHRASELKHLIYSS